MGEGFLNRYETKLYNPNSLSGEPNNDILELSRGLEKRLHRVPGFIGVVPQGSKMRGYSLAGEHSDYDIAVLFDPVNRTEKNPTNLINAKLKRFEGSDEFDFDPMPVDLDGIFEKLNKTKDWDKIDSEFNPLSTLFQVAIGPGVDSYREKVVRLTSRLPVPRQEELKRNLALKMTGYESLSREKIAARTGNTKGTIKEAQWARLELYKKRINKLFDYYGKQQKS